MAQSHRTPFLHTCLCVLLLASAARCRAGAADERLRALCRDLGNSNEGRRWASARELVKAGPKVTDLLGEILRGGWVDGQQMAAWVLGEIGDKQAIAPLATALESKDSEVRWKAASSLVKIWQPSIPALSRVASTGSLEARKCAAWALGTIGEPEAAPCLASLLDDDDEELRWKAAIGLKEIGKPAVPALARVFGQRGVQARRCAVWALGKIGGKAALPGLAKAVADRDEEVRAKAVIALGKIDSPEARKLLSHVSKSDPVEYVRKHALEQMARQATATGAAAAAQKQREAPKWGMFTAALSPIPNRALSNPFLDARLTAKLLSPSGKRWDVKGFFAGGNTWKFRFAPGETGNWYYTMTYVREAEEHVSHGMFRCVDGDNTGFVRTREDSPQYLTREDGSAFYPIGCGTYPATPLGPRGPTSIETWQRYLSHCAASGANKLRLLLTHTPQTHKDAVAKHPEASPWPMDETTLRYELDRFELSFWERLDVILASAQKQGLVVELTLFDEQCLSGGRNGGWADHPFNAANGGGLVSPTGTPDFYDLSDKRNRRAQQAFASYLLARTAAFSNVYYELMNEINERDRARPFGESWTRHWVRFFDENDPYEHLLSLSVGSDGLAYHQLPGIDVANVHGLRLRFQPELAKPQVFESTSALDEASARSLLWRAFLAGGGATCGTGGAEPDPTQPLSFCGPLAAFVRDLEYWRLRPDNSVVLMAPETLRVWAATSGRESVAYLAGDSKGAEIEIGLPAGRYAAKWYDPRTGQHVSTKEGTQKKGSVRLETPFFRSDMVLLLRAIPALRE